MNHLPASFRDGKRGHTTLYTDPGFRCDSQLTAVVVQLRREGLCSTRTQPSGHPPAASPKRLSISAADAAAQLHHRHVDQCKEITQRRELNSTSQLYALPRPATATTSDKNGMAACTTASRLPTASEDSAYS